MNAQYFSPSGVSQDAHTRRISEIARDIRQHWPKVHFAAKPYLDAMAMLGTMKDTYGQDSAESVVVYFLSNARSWRGPDAQRIKAELNGMLKSC